MTIALLFSGQGSQKTGMGQDLYETQAPYRDTIDHASQVLGIDLPACTLMILKRISLMKRSIRSPQSLP